MVKIRFYDLDEIEDNKLSYAVNMARYENKWVFVKHQERTTWEIPGGRREESEDINQTAGRELYEETGAVEFEITPLKLYSVEKEGSESFGLLSYAEINKLGKLPESEIEKIDFFDSLPENLTYPEIQPFLFDAVIKYLKKEED